MIEIAEFVSITWIVFGLCADFVRGEHDYPTKLAVLSIHPLLFLIPAVWAATVLRMDIVAASSIELITYLVYIIVPVLSWLVIFSPIGFSVVSKLKFMSVILIMTFFSVMYLV
jgi:hypothetical protein